MGTAEPTALRLRRRARVDARWSSALRELRAASSELQQPHRLEEARPAFAVTRKRSRGRARLRGQSNQVQRRGRSSRSGLSQETRPLSPLAERLWCVVASRVCVARCRSRLYTLTKIKLGPENSKTKLLVIKASPDCRHHRAPGAILTTYLPQRTGPFSRFQPTRDRVADSSTTVALSSRCRRGRWHSL